MTRTATFRLVAAWMTTAIVYYIGARIGHLPPAAAIVCFVWLLGIILWSAFGVVHEAEELAERLGEPRGTLVLTLSIVVIEVALISAVMLGQSSVPTLGRDTMFAVLMIVLNGVVGLGLLIGGVRHHQQSYNLQGAGAYLAIIIPLAVIALVLPSFTTTTGLGTLSFYQAVFFSLFTVALYALFLWLQTGRYRGFFAPTGEPIHEGIGIPLPHVHPAPGSTPRHVVLLLANILPIVLLSKSLAKLLDKGLAELGAPVALGGIVIAMIVFTPEAISALKAVAVNQLTRAINLCLGAAASTLGLTVPAVLLLGVLTDQPVILGLSSANMVLLAVTLVLNTLTFSGTRTTMLEGAVHLTMFLVFLVLVFNP
jgi:Ca2+:H+ antiporter